MSSEHASVEAQVAAWAASLTSAGVLLADACKLDLAGVVTTVTRLDPSVYRFHREVRPEDVSPVWPDITKISRDPTGRWHRALDIPAPLLGIEAILSVLRAFGTPHDHREWPPPVQAHVSAIEATLEAKGIRAHSLTGGGWRVTTGTEQSSDACTGTLISSGENATLLSRIVCGERVESAAAHVLVSSVNHFVTVNAGVDDRGRVTAWVMLPGSPSTWSPHVVPSLRALERFTRRYRDVFHAVRGADVVRAIQQWFPSVN